MKKTVRTILIALVCCLVFGAAAYAVGGSFTKELIANYVGVNLVVNGTAITPKDANGNSVEPFIVDGTTYLPVRAVAEALGQEVGWDGNTKTVYIGKQPGPAPEPAPEPTPVPESFESGSPVTIAGVLLNIDSAGGVAPTVCWRNNSEKQIKYLTLTITPYNAVDDPVQSSVGNLSTTDLKITGPANTFDPYSDNVYYFKDIASASNDGHIINHVYFNKVYIDDNGQFYLKYGLIGKVGTLYLDDRYPDCYYDQSHAWNPIWYNGDVRYLVIEKAVVEYMDGTFVTLNQVPVNLTLIAQGPIT